MRTDQFRTVFSTFVLFRDVLVNRVYIVIDSSSDFPVRQTTQQRINAAQIVFACSSFESIRTPNSHTPTNTYLRHATPLWMGKRNIV